MRGLVRAKELGKMICLYRLIIVLHNDLIRYRTDNCTALFGNNAHSRIDGSLGFHSRTYDGSFRFKKRNCLTLHVGSHESTVCIVILKERNECRSYREHHLGRHIHEIKHRLVVFLCLIAETTGYVVPFKVPFIIQRLISLCYMVIVLFVGCHVYNLIRYPRVFGIGMIYLSVRSLNKSVLIDPCVARK